METSDQNVTWTDLWTQCSAALGSTDDARRIIERISGRGSASWFITLTQQAPQEAIGQVDKLVKRRLAGEPLQYVLGGWGFRQLDLQVDKRVLIPRPETEQVVDAAIRLLEGVDKPVVVDLGTGSGAIALSIALEVHDTQVYATDVSNDALAVAAINLAEQPKLGSRVRLLQGEWFNALPEDLRGQVDMVISNPPYIAEAERLEVPDVVKKWEPENALFAGEDGLDAIRIIFDQVNDWLTSRGALVVEIAPSQAPAVEKMAWDAGFFSVEIGRDLAGLKRWVAAKK